MFPKITPKKYYVHKITKQNLIQISSVLKTDIEHLFHIIQTKNIYKNILNADYMKDYEQRFKLRLVELKSIISQFIHYPSFYGLLNNYTELLSKANNQRFCKTRKQIDFSLLKHVRRHFDLIKQQIVYIA